MSEQNTAESMLKKKLSSLNRIDRSMLVPLLFGLYPILFLFAENLGEIRIEAVIRSLLLAQAFVLLHFFSASLLLKSQTKAAILTCLAIAIFFSYGHVYELLRSFYLAGVLIGRHRFLISGALVIYCAALWFLFRLRTIHPAVVQFLGASAILLIIFPLVQVIFFLAQSRTWVVHNQPDFESEIIRLTIPQEEPARDVYYIILDAYTRHDVLRDHFEFDNSSFLSALEDLNFRVARESRSNYAITRLSLPSALNMEYIDKLGYPLEPNAKDAQWLDRIGRYSLVRKSFEAAGYSIVAFESAYGLTNWIDSDLYLSPRPISMSDAIAFGGMNEFEQLLIQTTMARFLIDVGVKFRGWFEIRIPDPNLQHRERILFALDRLGQLHQIPGPKFVFIHIMSPHPPYIFQSDGSLAPADEIFSLAAPDTPTLEITEIEAYRQQVQYLNTRLLMELESLIEGSEVDPIIVVQGDHGAFNVSQSDRLKILNTYLLPGTDNDVIYNSISPVNTFRIIFNSYFDTNLPLLADRSYYSEIKSPFQLELIQ
jgi:hypothetical protein